MAPNPESTRRQLIAAAERLFAERGIDAVSLREINAAALQRNASALQYHFTDRRGLVRAVLTKHVPSVEAARHAMLDQYRTAGRDDLRALVSALVRPTAAKLADRDGGRYYLRIHAQLISQLAHAPDADASAADSTTRWRAMVAPLLDDIAVRTLHHRFAAIRFTFTELSRRAAGAQRRDDQLFTSNLVDLVTAMLAAPIGDETRALLAARTARSRGL